jgi:hypothetical protein
MAILPRLTFKNKSIAVNPDPIIIEKNMALEIELYADVSDFGMGDLGKLQDLRWIIKFANGSPFNTDEANQSFTFQTTRIKNSPVHAKIVRLGKAVNEGSYKYDVSLVNSHDLTTDHDKIKKENILADEDPIVIVIPMSDRNAKGEIVG